MINEQKNYWKDKKLIMNEKKKIVRWKTSKIVVHLYLHSEFCDAVDREEVFMWIEMTIWDLVCAYD